jgi:ribose 5-phosphate isomerase B
MRKVYLTSDHGGFELKGKLKEHLVSKGFDVEDIGPHKLDPEDDYPDFAHNLVSNMTANSDSKGIAICRSAQGMGMALNRAPHIRAAVAWNVEEAKKSREHNDANALCLSADHIDDQTNFEIAEAWLNEPFSGEERHIRRIKKFDSLVT